jgi:DNA-binding NarL/FixJ family response regulator
MRVSVAVADATRMSSQLIAAALKRRRNSFDVCSLTGDSSEIFLELKNSPPPVAVISAQLEDGRLAGFNVLHQLRASNVKIPTVMLLDSDERGIVIDAFQAGARGIFCRGSAFDALPKCIRRVREGHIWISNAELEFLLELVTTLKPFQLESPSSKTLLTPRERDVVRLVAEGMRNQEIGDALSLGEHTVRNYIFRVFDKLGLSSRVELVLYALSRENSFDDQSPRNLASTSAPALPVTGLSRAMASQK